MIGPSELVLRAAGRKPLGEPAKQAGRCAMCGSEHKEGDLIMPFKPADSFTDWASLRMPQSSVICGWCVEVWNADFTQKYLKSVVSLEGVFPCAKNDHIAYWLLNPPPPPFLIFLGDQKRQHLVWRTDMSLSRDVFSVRFGEKQMLIRREKLVSGLAACHEVVAALNLDRKKGKLKSPFRSLARELDDFQHGSLRQDVLALYQTEPTLQPYIDCLLSLTPGEIWGLTAVLYAQNPHRPEAVLSPN